MISTKTKYGIRALIDLVKHYQGMPIYLRDISRRENIPLRYLENIFYKLKKGGILLSTKGRGGGFELAKSPGEIKLSDIVEILESNYLPSRCVRSPNICDRSSRCNARGIWVKLGEKMKEFMDSITLEDIIKENIYIK